jgi:hypothetical protein
MSRGTERERETEEEYRVGNAKVVPNLNRRMMDKLHLCNTFYITQALNLLVEDRKDILINDI